jgi:putative endonuclease
MTTATRQARGAVVVESVDFAVPGGGTIGPRFATWQEAVNHAREGITRLEYRGQQVNEDAPEFHPRRHFQEGATLVIYTRAFVHMRTVTAQYPPGGGQPDRTDGVACVWEVFQDGTVERAPDASERRPEVPEQEQAAARQMESAGYRILDRWESADGGHDIVAADGTTLVVCQVRPRTTGTWSRPGERDQLRKLAAEWLTARATLATHLHEVRVDLALYYTDQGRYAIEYIPGVG